jgi:hypothetical protein
MTSTMLFSGTTIKYVQIVNRTKTFTPISNKYKIQKAGSYQSLRHDGQGAPFLLCQKEAVRTFRQGFYFFTAFSLTLEHLAY